MARRRSKHIRRRSRRPPRGRSRRGTRKRPPKKKRSELERIFYKINKFVRHHPVLSAIVSVLLAIVLIRTSFSNMLFGNDVTEFRLWFLFFALVIGIIGIIALKVWFKNNVARYLYGHKKF